MRLFEIMQPSLYLATSTKQVVGEVVYKDSQIYPLGWALEGRLDARRPSESLARSASLYLHSHPTKDAFLYEVKPIGSVERNHTGWLRKLVGADLGKVGEIDHYATGYWSGEMLPEARDQPWEFRCLQAKIVKAIVLPQNPLLGD